MYGKFQITIVTDFNEFKINYNKLSKSKNSFENKFKFEMETFCNKYSEV